MKLPDKHVILYGLTLAGLLFLLKKLEWHFIVVDYSFEIYATLIALLFTGLGIWLALKLAKPKVETKTVVIEKEIFRNVDEFKMNQANLVASGISKRELEVLQLMAKGLSNQEIADALFVSLNTVKTHSSKLFEKLSVNKRIQAIDAAKQLGLIP
ncbi:MAG: DNA-binding response regulator [Bacteroidetes bacterium]|nr:MAG: DNA-binding response regulator [Bacteroidota bacterium]